MSLRNLISDNVDLAFEIIGDLKSTIIFTTTTASSYSFTSGEVTQTSKSLTIQGYLEEIKPISSGEQPLVKEQAKILVKKSDLTSDYQLFDSFTVDGKTYVIETFEDNDYVVTFYGNG